MSEYFIKAQSTNEYWNGANFDNSKERKSVFGKPEQIILNFKLCWNAEIVLIPIDHIENSEEKILEAKKEAMDIICLSVFSFDNSVYKRAFDILPDIVDLPEQSTDLEERERAKHLVYAIEFLALEFERLTRLTNKQ